MMSLGAEQSVTGSQSVDLFPPVDWTARDATTWPETDYPGFRPTGSWRLHPDGELHGLDPAGPAWRDRKTGECVDVADRHWVLAYGSNPDPAKLLARAGFCGGDGVIAMRAAVFGWAAAWCDARRRVDLSVVATLVPAPGRVEVHPVFALTEHQLDAMDAWEGHPDYYRRVRHEDPVLLENGRPADDVEVYLGTEEHRPPRLDADGNPLLCAEVPYRVVDELVARR